MLLLIQAKLIYNLKITNNIRLHHKVVNIYAEAEEQFVNKITSQTDFWRIKKNWSSLMKGSKVYTILIGWAASTILEGSSL